MVNAPQTLTVTETHRLLDALMPKNATHKQLLKAIRNRIMALLMLDAGLRVGEVVKLSYCALFFNEQPVNTIIVTAFIAKNKQERQIPVSSRLRLALEEYHKHYKPLNTCFEVKYAFFTSTPFERMTTRQVERIITAAGRRAIGRPVHPHVLRHTFASKLMRVTDMRTVQELLGHKHITSTQVYTHPNEDDKKKAISTLDEQVSEELLDKLQLS